MIETSGTNPTLPKEAVSSKEIPLQYLVDRISSIPDQTKKVEKTRIALHYLLAEGRMVHSVDLLREIHAEKLPFYEGERNNMLKSILDVAQSKCREDPSDAYSAIENIRYSMERSESENYSTFLTKQEYGEIDREVFANTSAIVTGRLIECMLNPSLPRGRYQEAFAKLDIVDIIRQAGERGYFDRIYNFLPSETKQQLDHHIPDDIKKKLGGMSTAVSAERAVGEMTAEERGKIGKISNFEDELIRWRHGDFKIDIEKLTNSLLVFFNGKEVDLQFNNVGTYSFDLASAIKDFKGIEPDTAEKIYQALAKRFLNGLEANDPVCLALLQKFPRIPFSYERPDRTRNIIACKSLYASRLIYEEEHNGITNEYEIERLDPKIISALNVKMGKAVLETWMKNSPTPTAPTGSVPETETEPSHKPVIEEVTIEGYSNIKRLTVDGTDLGYIFVKQHGEGNYTLDSGYNKVNTLQDLDIPKGMEVYFFIKANPSSASQFEAISIIGGEGATLNLKELFSLEILANPVVHILTTKYDGWEERASKGLSVGRGGQAVIHNLDANASVYDTPDLSMGTWMSMDKLEDFLKTRKEEIEKVVNPEVLSTAEAQPLAKIEVMPLPGEETKETDPVRIFIRRHSDKLGDPTQYGRIRYSAVRKECLEKGSDNIMGEDEIWFDNYEDFKKYLSGLTPREMKIMKEIRNIGGILSLNISLGEWGAEKRLSESIDSDPELKKAMYSKSLLGKSLLDRIRFGEYKAPKKR